MENKIWFNEVIKHLNIVKKDIEKDKYNFNRMLETLKMINNIIKKINEMLELKKHSKNELEEFNKINNLCKKN